MLNLGASISREYQQQPQNRWGQRAAAATKEFEAAVEKEGATKKEEIKRENKTKKKHEEAKDEEKEEMKN